MSHPETPLLLQGKATNIGSKIQKSISSSKSGFSYSGISAISSFTNEYPISKNFDNNLKENLLRSISRKSDNILKAIRLYDRLGTGKILPVHFYNVLRVYCFPLSYKEFESFIKEVPEDESGYISYQYFLFDQRAKGLEQNASQPDSETWADINYLNMEDLEIKIKNKIQKNLKNFIRCLWLHDLNNEGFIRKDDFKTVLENICFPLNNELFDRFWSLYDPCHSGVINYKDFLLKLGSHAESYKRLFPQSKKNGSRTSKSHNTKYTREEQIQLLYAKLGRDDPRIQGQRFSQTLKIFTEKAKKVYPLLLRTLQIKDQKCTGCINLSVFHQVLNYFVMPTSIALFKEILRSFNVPTNTTTVAWHQVLKRVCEDYSEGTEERDQSLKGSFSWKICKSVVETLKKHGKNADNFFRNALTLSAPNGEQNVTRSELKRIINQSLTLPISDEEFKHMMFLLDPNHSNLVNCQKFLALFKTFSEQEKEKNVTRLFGNEMNDTNKPDKKLAGEKLKKTFRKYFNKNLKNIEKTLFAFDKEEAGTISIPEFKKILDVFCFPMTENQYFEILNGFTLSNKVYYGDIINANKKGLFEDEEKWKACINKLVSPKVGKKACLDTRDVSVFIKEIIKVNKESLKNEFLKNDLCNIGAVRKDVFFKILEKFVFKLTEEQLEIFWSGLPKNDIGLLKYEEFLNEWCSADHSIKQNKSSPAIGLNSSKIINSANIFKERPKTTSSTISRKSKTSTPRPMSAASKLSSSTLSIKADSDCTVRKKFTDYGVLTKQQYNHYKSLSMERSESNMRSGNTEGINIRMRDASIEENATKKEVNKNDFEKVIQRRWRDILRRCKQCDANNHDMIQWKEFIGILEKTGISIDERLEKTLANKYGLNKNAEVNYWVFLNKSLSKTDSQQCHRTDDKISPKQESTGLSKVLLSYRDKILKNYRDLQHAFQRADHGHTKHINTPEFKKILMLHKIYMKDEDLFYIQDYFDTMLRGQIPYDAFLRAFAKPYS